jgi:hypothetical protein
MSEFEDSKLPQPQPGSRRNPPRPPKITALALEDDPEWRGSIIDEVEKRLAKFPDAPVQRGISWIRCLPCNPYGFAVELKVDETRQGDRYSVAYTGPHVQFVSRRDAVIAFGWGLSNGLRIRQFSRKEIPYRWIIELGDHNGTNWSQGWDYMPWSVGVWQFWHKPTIRYLQNHLIDLYGDQLRSAA